jgi:hypothetical protein
MMQLRRKRNNPAESAPRAHDALAHAAHMVAQAMHRETELEEYQRKFLREALKRAVGEISCLLKSAWLGERVTPTGPRARERLQCPVKGREATVVFVRAPDGSKDDVASCSLLGESGSATCEKACLYPAH